MVTYVIASKARSQYLAEVQALGEFLEKNCPGVSVKLVIKHKSEWSEFLDAVRDLCIADDVLNRPVALTVSLSGPAR
jgi:hypothetical protein